MTEQLGTKGQRVSRFQRIKNSPVPTVVLSRVNLDNEVGKTTRDASSLSEVGPEGACPAYEAIYWAIFATSTLHQVSFIIVQIFFVYCRYCDYMGPNIHGSI